MRLLQDKTVEYPGLKKYGCNRPQVFVAVLKDDMHMWNMNEKTTFPPYEGLPFLHDIAGAHDLDYYAIDPGSIFDLGFIQAYKVVVLNDSFEYMTVQQIEALRAYVKSGGRLLLNVREYSYSIVSQTPGNVIELLGYRHALPGMHQMHEFFGVGITPGRWIEWASPHAEPLKVIAPNHPLFEDIEFTAAGTPILTPTPLTVGGWVRNDSRGVRRCLVAKYVDCTNSVVLAETRWISPVANTSMVIAAVGQGKGYAVIMPGIRFSHSKEPAADAIRKNILAKILSLDIDDMF